jgi:hypothetical protein
MQRLTSYLIPTVLIPESYKFSLPSKTRNLLLLFTLLLLFLNCDNHHLLFENIDTQVWLRVTSQLQKFYWYSRLPTMSWTINLGNNSHWRFQRSLILEGINMMIMFCMITQSYVTSHMWVIDHWRARYMTIQKRCWNTLNVCSTSFLELS